MGLTKLRCVWYWCQFLMGEAFLPIYTAHWYTVGILEENKINGWDTVGE